MSSRFDLQHPQTALTVLPSGINMVSLGLLTYGITTEGHLGKSGGHLAAVVLLVVTVAAWMTWALGRGPEIPRPLTAFALGVMALAGGALAGFAPLAIVFPAVAALGAAMSWRLPVVGAVATGGWAATLITVAVEHHSFGVALGALAAILAGILVGFSRRQAVERTQQTARFELEIARAEVERTRAELLSERNHLARELHDVLAHTLAALSLQLEAFGTVIEAEPDTSPAVRDQLERTRRLVREGLDEARGAVQALRDDAPSLADQLAKLSTQQRAAFSVEGTARPLPPPVVLGLYRVTQEALTNVMKHATGAPTTVALGFLADVVTVTVDNEAAAHLNGAGDELRASGGGYGLRGIAERLAPLGGTLEAGPSGAGWRVRAVVPVPADAPVADGVVTP